MRKSFITLLHVGFWACYLIIIVIMLGVFYRSGGRGLANAFGNLFYFALLPSVLSFYICYLFLFPKYLLQKKILLSSMYGFFISIGSALIGYALLRHAIRSHYILDMDKRGDSTALGVVLIMTFIALISGIVALVIRGFITWFEEIKLKEELKQKNHEIEMALVKAQLDPHFLFNTINNIDVLILKNATEASNYLNKLSDIIRFMLYETKASQILLSKEVEYIEKYIELQKIRTSNTNYVNFSIEGMLSNKTIAPMVFIPFIENAFKHTTNKKTDNAISISIKIAQKSITLVCENKYNSVANREQGSNGLGNDLIRKRLHLIYPQKHHLEVNNRSNLYSVRLTLDHE